MIFCLRKISIILFNKILATNRFTRRDHYRVFKVLLFRKIYVKSFEINLFDKFSWLLGCYWYNTNQYFRFLHARTSIETCMTSARGVISLLYVYAHTVSLIASLLCLSIVEWITQMVRQNAVSRSIQCHLWSRQERQRAFL